MMINQVPGLVLVMVTVKLSSESLFIGQPGHGARRRAPVGFPIMHSQEADRSESLATHRAAVLTVVVF